MAKGIAFLNGAVNRVSYTMLTFHAAAISEKRRILFCYGIGEECHVRQTVRSLLPCPEFVIRDGACVRKRLGQNGPGLLVRGSEKKFHATECGAAPAACAAHQT